jgi:hypothetical protein
MKTFYECGYGGNASIQTKSDGTAVLRMFAGGKTERRTCKSVTSAKRLLSRWTDGLYKEVKNHAENQR